MDVVIIVSMVNILLAGFLCVGVTPITVWWERRVSGFIQDRSGPNRCSVAGIRLGGLIQSIADSIKLLFKEDFMPSYIKYKSLYTLAPVILFLCSFFMFAVIPFADNLVIDDQSYMMQAIPTQLGIMWFLAYAGLSVYGIIMGGYASDNKYALLGSIRASAQVISYEAAMGLSLISMLITYGSIHLNDMVTFQGELLFGFIPAWGIILQPLAALIFIVTAFAETNRAPFDIAEGESEIVSGYHTEYSAMRFGLFQVGEYAALSASSAIIVTLFFGGYHIPWMNTQAIQNNIYPTLSIIALALLVLTFLFTQWIQRNNQWINKKDARSKETKILIISFWILSSMIAFTLLLLVTTGLGTNGINIATTVIQIGTFLIKFFLMNFVFIWIRWTLLRFRYDQLQMLGWKVLLPLALLNIFITATFVVLIGS